MKCELCARANAKGLYTFKRSYASSNVSKTQWRNKEFLSCVCAT